MQSIKDVVLKIVPRFNVTFDVESYDSIITTESLCVLNNIDINSLIIEETWVSGGLFGNDCYEYKDLVVDSECEKDIVPSILLFLSNEGIAVDESIIRSMVQTHTFNGEVDYYNNHYIYTRVYLNVKDLYDRFFFNID